MLSDLFTWVICSNEAFEWHENLNSGIGIMLRSDWISRSTLTLWGIDPWWGPGRKTVLLGLPAAKPALPRGWNSVWQYSCPQISVCLTSYHSLFHDPGWASGKQSLQGQRGAVGLGTWPPLSTSSPFPAAALPGSSWRGRLLGHTFRLPCSLNSSLLLVNPMIKALTFNETWEGWMP